MKLRITTEPTDDELIQLIKDDPIGRNDELRYLIQLLDSSYEGLSVFLNGPWGCGKSYFVRQAELLLRLINPNLRPPHGLTAEDCSSIIDKCRRENNTCRQYLPVYFNAWKHDAFGEPILSLMCDIADMEDIAPEFEFNLESFKVILENIASCVVKSKLPFFKDYIDESVGFAEAFTNLASAKLDPLQDYRNRKKLEKYVSELVVKAREAAGSEKKPADAIVIFVDELDRCRPSYAIEVLESVKHLLVRSDVIVVFSVDASQLAEVIRGAYGVNYNAEHYLKRFYDVKLRFNKVNPESFLTKVLKQLPEARSRFNLVARELVLDSGLVMRDIVQYCEAIDRARDLHYYLASELDGAIRNVVHPAICYLQITNQPALDRLENVGEIDDAFLTHVTSARIAGGILGETLANMPSFKIEPGETEAIDNRRTLMRALLLAYVTDEDVPLHKEALLELGDYNINYESRRDSIRKIQQQGSLR